jgi:hypothetical protein
VELVDEALTPVFGSVPTHDDDDDVPVIHGGSIAYVWVEALAPTVEVFPTVVQDVTDPDAASFEVNVLHRDSVFVRYALVDQVGMGHLCLPAHPFVPQHRRDLMAVLTQALDAAAPDLAHRVGGTRPPSRAPRRRRQHPTMTGTGRVHASGRHDGS